MLDLEYDGFCVEKQAVTVNKQGGSCHQPFPCSPVFRP